MLEAAGLDACAGIEKGLVSERHLTLARGFSLPPPRMASVGSPAGNWGRRGLEINECLLNFLFNMDLRNLQMPINSTIFPYGLV